MGLTIALGSCLEEHAMIEKQPSFFDLKGYFDAQTARLSETKRVKKTTEIDGEKIEKIIDSIDFDEELKVFKDSDINKIAWLDKYRVDSIFNEEGLLSQIRYESVDKKLRTQELLISFSQNEVDTIEIFNNASSTITKLQQHLRYIPSYGYAIESSQKLLISDRYVVVVEVQFLK